MFDTGIKGKTAFVTGASSGLGAHFAETLARAGAHVIAAARREEALADTCRKIVGIGGSAEPLQLDIADAKDVEQKLAGLQAHIIVNNAGIANAEPALDIDDHSFSNVIETNLNGAFRVAQAAAKEMVKSGEGGTIINIASILGMRVSGQVGAYAASKAGLIHLTKALALEWARYDIRVNAICPGYIGTPINESFFASEAGQKLIRRIPQRRLGNLNDLDGPLLLLASDAGAFMTGSVLAVDGGHLVSTL